MLLSQTVLPCVGWGGCCYYCKFERCRRGLVGSPFLSLPLGGLTVTHLCWGDLTEATEQVLGARVMPTPEPAHWFLGPSSPSSASSSWFQGAGRRGEAGATGNYPPLPGPHTRASGPASGGANKTDVSQACIRRTECVTSACRCSSSGGIGDGFFLATSGPSGAEVLNQGHFAPWSLGRIWRHAYLPRLVGGQKHGQAAYRGGRHLPHRPAPSVGRAEVERLS